MIRAVLFDLDGTLLDTRCLDTHRDARRWAECRRAVGDAVVFDGVRDTLAALRAEGIRVAIVTSSPDSAYAKPLLAHHGITFDHMTAYHDTTRHKPGPEPNAHALERLGLGADDVVGVGDLAVDADSLRAAGITAYGAGWSPTIAATASWHEVLPKPALLLDRIGLKK